MLQEGPKMYKLFNFMKKGISVRTYVKALTFGLSILVSNQLIANSHNNISYSLFGEGGETESVFIIDGRNFPVKIGSIGVYE